MDTMPGDPGPRGRRPKFVTHAGAPDLRVIADGYCVPTMHPQGLITVSPNGNAAYERLFSDVQPDGTWAAQYHPGTFGMLVAAGRGFRG